ncbi:MAG: hypothetical protein GKR90_14250 [Pseudomonadales bacterium]|nr:hypothetical protein [Pseudomonadales bacterium]
MDDSVKQPARNVNIASGAILIYVLAGGDITGFQAGSFTMPVERTWVLSWAAVLVWAWMYYQYFLATSDPWKTVKEKLHSYDRTHSFLVSFFPNQPVTEEDLDSATQHILTQMNNSQWRPAGWDRNLEREMQRAPPAAKEDAVERRLALSNSLLKPMRGHTILAHHSR